VTTAQGGYQPHRKIPGRAYGRCSIRHRIKIRAYVDGIGDDKKNNDRLQQPDGVMFAYVGRDTPFRSSARFGR
jgi:hypothetical protein